MSTTTHSVERHLLIGPAAYDATIRKFIPFYEEMLATAVELLRDLMPKAARVLDLGGGTGALTQAIGAAFPDATLTLLDVDREMLAQASMRLKALGPRLSLLHGSFAEALPESDAIVASLALHHIRELDAKAAVYANIQAALPPGAPFLSLDATLSDDPKLNALAFERWAKAMGAHGISPDRAYAHFAEWAGEDRYVSLPDELDALRRAGFRHPEVFWRRGPVAIFGALGG